MGAESMQVLRAARLFDGVSSRSIEHALVFVDGGVITAVEGGTQPPEDAEVLDLGNVTLLPGLIDTHVHLGFDAGPDPVANMLADDDTTLILRMRHAAARALAAGITTVRDLGDRRYLGIVLRDWFRAGRVEPGPEILTAGPPITVTGGHCHFMGGEADGELEVRRAVRARVKHGVDVIKVMATGGNLTPGTNPQLPQYTVTELAAAVDEAHRLGRKLTAHAHGPAGIAVAVEAGVDGLEHCSFVVRGGREVDPRLVERIAEQHIAVCPTVGVVPGAPRRPEAARLVEGLVALLEGMHRAGVRLIAGTDAGVAPGKPHDVLPHGVRMLSQAGLTNAEALRAATSEAAAACAVDDRKGSLTAGKEADILAVAGDPLADLAALFQVRAVFRAGQRVI
jgi:imidazolonepropionase-like amidohydrolase